MFGSCNTAPMLSLEIPKRCIQQFEEELIEELKATIRSEQDSAILKIVLS